MIRPSVGRVLWVFNHCNTSEQPRAAIIVHVNSDDNINVVCFDEEGRNYGIKSLPLVQDGEPVPVHAAFAQWMPYQIGQAKAQSHDGPLGMVADGENVANRVAGWDPTIPSEPVPLTDAELAAHASDNGAQGQLGEGAQDPLCAGNDAATEGSA